MEEESSIKDLFETLLKEDKEKKIIRLIVDDKEPEEIVGILLNSKEHW